MIPLAWSEAMLVTAGVMLLVVALIYIVGWIIDSCMKMKVFRMFGTCSPILAWAPCVSSYMLGRTCNGKDGGMVCFAGKRCSNAFLNWGWTFSFICTFLSRFLSGVLQVGAVEGAPPVVTDFILGIPWGTISIAFNIYYMSCIYSFIFSRMNGRPERDVRGISFVSAVFEIVAVFSILCNKHGQVYSLENDMFPEERGPFGGRYGGGYGQSGFDSYQDRYSDPYWREVDRG